MFDLVEKHSDRRDFLKLLGIAGAGAGALALGACAGGPTPAEIEADINTACMLLPIGTTLAVALLSSIPGLAPLAPLTTVISTAVESDCSAFATAVEKAIELIVGAGATATVSVSSSTSAAAAVRFGKHVAAHYHAAHFKATSAGITFIVKPSILLCWRSSWGRTTGRSRSSTSPIRPRAS